MGYTFPLSSLAIALMITYQATGILGFAWLATIVLLLASLGVMMVSVKTIIVLKQKIGMD